LFAQFAKVAYLRINSSRYLPRQIPQILASRKKKTFPIDLGHRDQNLNQILITTEVQIVSGVILFLEIKTVAL